LPDAPGCTLAEAMDDAAQTAMRTVVGDYTVTEVLTERRLEIANEAQEKLQNLLDLYDTGLRVVTVKMQNVTPPSDAVKRAFKKCNEARKEKGRRRKEPRKAYKQAVRRARGEGERTVTRAEGTRVNRVNTAKGDVARFSALLAEYRKAPDVTRRRLYLETMRAILPAVGQTYVFDADQAASFLPFLDLKQGNGLPMKQPAEEK